MPLHSKNLAQSKNKTVTEKHNPVSSFPEKRKHREGANVALLHDTARAQGLSLGVDGEGSMAIHRRID